MNTPNDRVELRDKGTSMKPIPVQRPDQPHDLNAPDHRRTTPAQLIMGNLRGDREFRRWMMHLWSIEEGVPLIELTPRDSRHFGKREHLQLTPAQDFTLDPSKLSCSNETEIWSWGHVAP